MTRGPPEVSQDLFPHPDIHWLLCCGPLPSVTVSNLLSAGNQSWWGERGLVQIRLLAELEQEGSEHIHGESSNRNLQNRMHENACVWPIGAQTQKGCEQALMTVPQDRGWVMYLDLLF